MLEDIDVKNLKNFAEYPFNLSMDNKMKELLESIIINGIITPLIVRKKMNIMKLYLDIEENILQKF